MPNSLAIALSSMIGALVETGAAAEFSAVAHAPSIITDAAPAIHSPLMSRLPVPNRLEHTHREEM